MKKILYTVTVVLIIAAMMLPLLTINVAAAERYASKYTGDGCIDTTWFDANDVKTEYHITTAGQLAGLSRLVSANPLNELKVFENIKFYLDCDIIFNEGNASDWAEGKNTEGLNKWTPIGQQQSAISTVDVNAPVPENYTFFWGSFDGQGHIISGLYIDDPDNMWTGLFSCFMGPYLGNLTITNSFIRGFGRVGAFAGIMHGTVAKAQPTKETADDYNKGNYALCENLYTDAYCYATANNTNSRAGGIFGVARILDKSNHTTRTNGGILVIRNCASAATVNTGLTDGRWGGGIAANIAGYASTADREGLYDVFFENCISTADLTSLGVNTGGLCSEIYCVDLVFKNCISALTNFNTLSTKEYGAFAGGGTYNGTSRYATVKFDNCYFVPVGILEKAVGALPEGSTEEGVTSITSPTFATGLDAADFDLLALRLMKGVVYPEELAVVIKDSPLFEQPVTTADIVTTSPTVTTPAPSDTTAPVTAAPGETTVAPGEITTAPAVKENKGGCSGGSVALGLVQLIAVIGGLGACLLAKKK